MTARATRRRFLQTTAAGGALAGLGDLGFLSRLPSVRASESRLGPQAVQLAPEIEPLVRLIESTSREHLLEEIAFKIEAGTTYREVLAALLLAGVRNVQPRPEVGFKFHAVLVVNSAHIASQSSPDEHRWLPIFWALDHFKESQARDEEVGDWTMAPVDESRVPSGDAARSALSTAMDAWDESAADVAAAAVARNLKPDEVFEIFCRYGARDFRSIGHKAIYVANAWRTLNEIGWQHGEPVLRSLAYALLKHDGTNPARSDLPADRPWRRNVELAARIRSDWAGGKLDDSATTEMLAVLRGSPADEACDHVVELLNRGIAPQSIWDALFVGAGELLVRQPAIVALHAVTSTNALRFAFDTTASDDTKRMLLLQNAAFLPLFRDAMKNRGNVADTTIDDLTAAPLASADQPLDEIFAAAGQDNAAAAGKILAYLEQHPDPKDLIDRARLLVFLKGNNSHDYKFSSAVLEDHAHVSPAWRNQFLAAGVYNLKGSLEPDNGLVARTRAALA